LPPLAVSNLPSEGIDERFRGPLMSFFLRRVGSRAEAEDLTQQVFLRLLGAKRPDALTDPAAFVFRIAANLLRDRHRVSQRRGEHIALEVLGAETGSVDDLTPERILLAQDAVRDALARLDGAGARTKEIFLLWRVSGMTQREVADWFGCSQRNVEKHILKATVHLMMRNGR